MRAISVAPGNASPNPKPNSARWTLLCVAVTVAALFLIFKNVPPRALLEILRTMRVGPFIAAIALYGIVFLPGAWRWHAALRVNDCIAGSLPTIRYTIIGHFFYLILFGGLGGDAAKAALYARRFRRPFAMILASVSLDRLMGSIAPVLLTAIVFAISVASGDFAYGQSFAFHGSAWWALLIPLVAISVLIFFKRSRGNSIMHRFAAAFVESGRRLMTSPKTIVPGVLCGLFMQAALNGVLALNLQAVSHEPLPWLRLMWTFPVITIVSGLPITFAGIGARDSAAIVLLGMCGIANANAEAMALLTLCVSVFWGLVGGIVLWCETHTGAEEVTPKCA